MNGNAHRIAFARLLLAAGKPAAAEAALLAILADTPDDGGALRLLGTLRLEDGEADAGADVLTRAVAVDPDSADAWHGLGVAAWQGRRTDQALRCGKRAGRLGADPSATAAFLHISRDAYDQAIVQYDGGAHADAAAIFRSLLDDPDEEVRRKATARLHCAVLDALRDNRAAEAVAVMPIHADGRIAISPLRVRIEVSSACNLRCRHCPTGVAYKDADRRLMKAGLFERVIESVKQLPDLVACVMYLGGEPLLHPQLAAMCRRVADETGVKGIHFNTNAMLLTEERCRELVGSGVSQINVSIDGRSPEENDRLRRGASYETVRDNVRMLVRHTRPAGIAVVIVNVVVRRPGDPETPETPAFLRRDLPDLPIDSSYAMRWPGWDAPDDEGDEESDDSGDGGGRLEVVVEPQRRSGHCLFPFSDMVVRANGNVTLCCYDLLGAEVMGSITDAPLAEIWNGPKYRALRLAMLEGRSADLPDVCRRCPVYTGEALTTGA